MRGRNSALTITLWLATVLSGNLAVGETYVSGMQSGSWGISGSPYIVIGDIVVPENNSLIIEAGVQVLFQGTHRILVDNALIAAYGNETDSVVFRPAEGYQNWGSIHILDTPLSKSCIFYYCLFARADGAAEDDRWGGAFYTQNGLITFEHCKFLYNRAYTGAGIFGHISTVSFDYCEFFQNYCDWKGGAINFNTCNVEIKHTAFCHNTANAEAGGIYAWLGDINMSNCTLANNSAMEGGGIFNFPGGTFLELVNCIIVNNYGGNISGPGYSDVTYTDIGDYWPGSGNIDENPLFVNPGQDNYHLLPESPCIDAGNPDSPFDPDGTVADMGAYYYSQTGPGGNLFLDVEPENPPVIIPAEGGSFDITVTATYQGPNYVIFDHWVECLLPNGEVVGPYFMHPNVYLVEGDAIVREATINVSGSAMPGLYEYRGYLGEYPDTIYASDYFGFEKLYGDQARGTYFAPYLLFTGWEVTEKTFLLAGGIAASSSLDLKCSPQPFNPETIFNFNLPQKGQAELEIYNLVGQQVAVLLDRVLAAGAYALPWNAQGLPSGVYLARLNTTAGSVTQRVLLLK